MHETSYFVYSYRYTGLTCNNTSYFTVLLLRFSCISTLSIFRISFLFLFFLLLPEFMHGGSIFDFLYNRRGNFQLSDVIRIASDVSKGMNYLHQINIVHRDLKTANLLMDDQVIDCSSMLLTFVAASTLGKVEVYYSTHLSA